MLVFSSKQLTMSDDSELNTPTLESPQGKMARLEEALSDVKQKQHVIEQKEAVIQQKEADIQQKEAAIQQKEAAIQHVIQQKEAAIQHVIQQKDAAIEHVIQQKDAVILELQNKLECYALAEKLKEVLAMPDQGDVVNRLQQMHIAISKPQE